MLTTINLIKNAKPIQSTILRRKSYVFHFSSIHVPLNGYISIESNHASSLSDGNVEVRYISVERARDSDHIVFNATIEVVDFYSVTVLDSIEALLRTMFSDHLDTLPLTMKSCNLRIMDMGKNEAKHDNFITMAKNLFKDCGLVLAGSLTQIGDDTHISAHRQRS